jgi:hypothetical protein
MEALYEVQGILIGIVGWAATALAVLSSSRLNPTERRMMVVCCWMLWMIPALGSLVYRGLLTTDSAALLCGSTTFLLGMIAILSSRRAKTKV